VIPTLTIILTKFLTLHLEVYIGTIPKFFWAFYLASSLTFFLTWALPDLKPRAPEPSGLGVPSSGAHGWGPAVPTELDEGEEEEEEAKVGSKSDKIYRDPHPAGGEKQKHLFLGFRFAEPSSFLSHLRGLLLHGVRSPQQDICSKDFQVSVIWDRPPACSTLQRSQVRDPAWMCWDPVEKWFIFRTYIYVCV
jgi:hypothetical protein